MQMITKLKKLVNTGDSTNIIVARKLAIANKLLDELNTYISDEYRELIKIAKCKNIEELFKLKSFIIERKLDYIPPAIKHLKNVTIIDIMYDGNIKELEGIFYLKHLNVLKISCGKMIKINTRIANLKQLHVLDLSSNHINELDIDLSSLNINELNLHDNKINSITDNFSLPSGIESFDISSNQVSELNDDIFDNCSQLVTIDLSYNLISELPSSIYKLKSLAHLFVHGTNIKYLDDRLLNLPNLYVLYINQDVQNQNKSLVQKLIDKNVDISCIEL